MFLLRRDYLLMLKKILAGLASQSLGTLVWIPQLVTQKLSFAKSSYHLALMNVVHAFYYS